MPSISSNQTGSILRMTLVCLVLLVSSIGIFRHVDGHAEPQSSLMKSGISGYCLDDYKDNTTLNNKVTAWSCNGSAAQSWTVSGDMITHHTTHCLGVQTDAKTDGSPVLANTCNNGPGQVWLRDNNGYFNPNSDLCLTAPAPNEQLTITTCNATSVNQTWQPAIPNGTATSSGVACNGSEGQKVACFAEKEWTTWQTTSASHNDLLNQYTDGVPYEEWCADFVSYVYKEAGYPFTSAYDGWDENDANSIQNYGFTQHLVSSGYTPKAGDIAYFDYNGGHVEIVVSGGKVPTFVYGDSATIDPSTNNGQMMANTITNDGAEGQLLYYLSLN